MLLSVADGNCQVEEEGAVLVRDDLDQLLHVLPMDIRDPLVHHVNRTNLLEVSQQPGGGS